MRGLLVVGALALLVDCRRAASHAPDADAGTMTLTIHAACDDLDACEKKCNGGDPSSCAEAGRIYEFGHGVATDEARAYVFYDASCDGGAVVGCYSEAVMLERGKGVARDRAKASELYSRVCRAGSTTACQDAHRTAVAE